MRRQDAHKSDIDSSEIVLPHGAISKWRGRMIFCMKPTFEQNIHGAAPSSILGFGKFTRGRWDTFSSLTYSSMVDSLHKNFFVSNPSSKSSFTLPTYYQIFSDLSGAYI
uniref:Uncharacterized protein n=1 Tax=Cacopsylla melanoneura TaxID=428564 RepID=A0A8D9BAB8_9HEMI